MVSPRKKFSLKDYEKNDMAFESLQKRFSFLHPHLRSEDYGVDVAVYNGVRALEKSSTPLCYLEIESKSNWKGKDFPSYFPDVQFLAKKQRLLQLEIPTYWVLFNDDCTNAGIINLRRIPTYKLDVVHCNKSSIGQDFFYRIPRNDMIWGIENLERFLIQDAFHTHQYLHKISTN